MGEDVTNSFKCHWCGKCQTCIDIYRFKESGNICDDVNYDGKVAGKADSQIVGVVVKPRAAIQSGLCFIFSP